MPPTTHATHAVQNSHVFKNGNSQAVRIPKALAFARSDLEVEVERIGDELRIRPARRPLNQLLAKLSAFSPDFMAEGRGDTDQIDRETLQ
ncbi:MAG: AbrB/MazE/SpoVT family DNA-binding domain-containing protein [Deltaproteobacteria bacterium]|nr:AbrB/MazE/SpoVT family DNA-binding domain-containing protein [Deltaproteobacteria bacterium]